MEVWLTCQHITNALTVAHKPSMEIWVINACHVTKNFSPSQTIPSYSHPINQESGPKGDYNDRAKTHLR